MPPQRPADRPNAKMHAVSECFHQGEATETRPPTVGLSCDISTDDWPAAIVIPEKRDDPGVRPGFRVDALLDRHVSQHHADAWIVAGDRCAIRVERLLRLGRTRENDCLLPERGVSRRHAIIHSDEFGGWWLLDLNTTNGTFLNGTRIEVDSRLRHGDRIRIGPFEFLFQLAGRLSILD
jgi:hypothetical protein